MVRSQMPDNTPRIHSRPELAPFMQKAAKIPACPLGVPGSIVTVPILW